MRGRCSVDDFLASLAERMVGDISVIDQVPTSVGVTLRIAIQDLETGASIDSVVQAPAGYADMDAMQRDAYLLSASRRVVFATLHAEVMMVVDDFRRGNNPLRSDNDVRVGTDHLSYRDAATALYLALNGSVSLNDKLLGARLVASLQDDDLAAISGESGAALRRSAADLVSAGEILNAAGVVL